METLNLPTDLVAERMVLGLVLLDDSLMHAARPVLNPDDFSMERHRRIWQCACELYDAGKAVDQITVFSAMQPHGWDEHDLLSYLSELDNGLPHLTNLDSYVKTVRDVAIRRKIMVAGHNLTLRAMQGTETPQQILTSMGQTLLTLVPQEHGSGLQSAKELVDEVGIDRLLSPRRDKGLMFPWPWMNYMTCGMLPAELWILAGYTSTGKTSAMLQHAVTAARRGQGVAIFSLEVGKESLFLKACYQLSRIDSEKAKRGEMDRDDRAALNRAAAEIYELPLYFDAQATTAMAIHAAVRRRMLQNKVDHVIVDYLQLLGNSGRHDNRAQAVGANAWAMKMLATDFQVPVLLLSQFSRPKDKQSKSEPELGDLKESGDIENHANGVWFLHRSSNEDAERIPVKFLLPKQRDGRRNAHHDFWFFPRHQRFEAVTEDE